MTEFYSQALLLDNYYDSLVNQVDIYTEELIEKCSRDQTFSRNLIDSLGDEKFTGDSATDYLNRIRQRLIDAIRTQQKQNLDAYEADRTAFEIDRENITEQVVETLRSRLFAHKFCFVIKMNELNSHAISSMYQMCGVFVDFYLNENEIGLLKKLIKGTYNSSRVHIEGQNQAEDRMKIEKIDVNQRILLVHIVKELISGLFRSQKCCDQIINLKKDALLSVEQVCLDYKCIKTVRIDKSPEIKLSSIKSFTVGCDSELDFKAEIKLESLNGLENVENLKINSMSLNHESLSGLQQLIRLELKNCDLDEFDCDLFNFLVRLQVLYINNSSGQVRIETNNLVSLKCIILERLANLELIGDLKNPDVFFIRLYDCKISDEKANVILQESSLPKLHALHLSVNSLTKLDCNWFRGLSNLVELNVSKNSIEYIESDSFEYLPNLKYLKLSNNKIRIVKTGTFSKLSNLKTLFLNFNRNLGLYNGIFEGLNSLEVLDLTQITQTDTKLRVEKDFFKGLNSLTILLLNSNSIEWIDAEAFVHMPRLKSLYLVSSNFRFDEATFSKLNSIELLDLSENGLNETDIVVLYKLVNSGVKVKF